MDGRIVLGSGKLYITEFSGKLPTRAEVAVDGNILGYIKGGAEVSYKPESYTASDDQGLVRKTIITKEAVSLKSGIMVFNGNVLTKLCSTARVTEASGVRTVKVGGIGNQDGKSYFIMFVHEDSVDGDITVSIVGKSTAGFKLSFKIDAETVIDAEFTAEPQDSEGTLVVYTEEIKNGAAPGRGV